MLGDQVRRTWFVPPVAVTAAGTGGAVVSVTRASAPAALRRPPVTARPVRPAMGSTPASMSALICATVSDGSRAASSAATPAACGAAIDVPSAAAYCEPVYVEMMFTPGAKRSTVVAP